VRRWIEPINRADALLAGTFVAAAAVEAVVRGAGGAAQLALGLGGAVAMLVLLLRRRHPVVMVSMFCVSGAAASVLQTRLPDESTDAFVPVVALIVMSYALGAYADRRGLALGAPQPIALIALVDLIDPGTEDVATGLVFAAAFVVLLPILAGRLVRSRRRLAAELRRLEGEAVREHEQQVRIARAEEAVAISESLEETLDAGLERLLATADIASVEERARALLATTRDAVVGLAHTPAPEAAPTRFDPPPRAAGPDDREQTWTVVVGAAVGTGLLVETSADWSNLPVGLALVAAVVGAVAWIARRPLSGAVVAWVAATALSRAVAPLGDALTGIGLTVALPFLVCWLAPRPRAALAVGVGLVGALAGIQMTDPAGATTLTALASVGGAILRDRTTLLAEVRCARAEADVRRRDELRMAVLEQRAALGRELHDSVGHALTVVALQAGAARRLRGTDPVAAQGARDAIERTARQALLDLRRGFESRPGGIDSLVATVRAAGLEVDVSGPPPPPDLAAVVHRVLQEALTNALRHAPGAAVVVRLRVEAADYTCMVRNPLVHVATTYPSGGRGLPGMRARAEEIGGTVEWSVDEEGFTVRARFPVRVGASR
jgi:signal transduction histidine kinase